MVFVDCFVEQLDGKDCNEEGFGEIDGGGVCQWYVDYCGEFVQYGCGCKGNMGQLEVGLVGGE